MGGGSIDGLSAAPVEPHNFEQDEVAETIEKKAPEKVVFIEFFAGEGGMGAHSSGGGAGPQV